ncbi:transmembrane protein 130 [Heptranchias perlo]|uniref:transmembrane protein 130 n=1 Tax=Heptranchias perlo TaxID=212740 RepID=UPI00355A5060
MASLKLLLFCLYTSVLSASSVQYYLALSNDGPITSGAQGTVEARLIFRAGSRLEIPLPHPNPYTFHWYLESPLSIVRRSERGFSCSITVRTRSPDVYNLLAWVTREGCPWCPPVAHGSTKLHVTNSVVGTLSLMQPNGTVASSTKGYELATRTPTKVSFILYDPSDYFNAASFRYTWHFGNGERLVTNESYVHHTYPTPGVYQLHVDVLAHLNHSQQKTGISAASLELLDAIQKIEVKAIDDIHADHRMDFYLYVNGSPPLKMCWAISRNCAPVVDHRCHPVELYRSSAYNLSYTFSDPGSYTFNVKAENSVSALQACYKITTRESGIHPVYFIVPCVTLLTVILLFILSVAVRNSGSRKHSVEVADFDFSPVTDVRVEEARVLSRRTIQTFCIPCVPLESHSLSEREVHSLLRFSSTPLQNYTQWPETCSPRPS